MYKLFLLISLLVSCNCFSQSVTGVWEGVIKLNERGTRTINFRLELFQSDGTVYGMFYTRGSDKSTVYGCDFIVTGQVFSNWLRLKPQHLQRAIVISKDECRYLNHLQFKFNTADSTVSRGTWTWVSGATSEITCTKVSNDVSLAAQDELTEYRKKLFELYEEQKVFLEPADRLNVPVKTVDADSSVITVELFSVEKNHSDSIDVYINDELIIEMMPLAVKPVKVVLQSLEHGDNGLLIVNRSKLRPSVKLLVRIRYKNEDMNFETASSFTRNTLIIFRRD